MPYGKLTPEMEEAIRPHVKGQWVWDLGAGDLGYTQRLLELGSELVIPVDKEAMSPELKENFPVEVHSFQGTFLHLATHLVRWQNRMDVAFVSWPVNWVTGLGRTITKADTVIYLGQNSAERGSACGGPGFWSAVAQRPLLKAVEHPKNTLLIYGPGEDQDRELHAEEEEAFRQWFPGLIEACEGRSP